MKQLRNILLLGIIVVFTNAANPVKSAYAIAKDYTVTINGTSNLHKWDEKVGTVTGSGTVNWNSDGSFDLDALSIKMNVASIKSDMGGVMDRNTYKALKADAHPEIIFTLGTALKGIKASASETTVSAKGTLSIAGVTKAINMRVKVFMQGQARLVFEGAQTIKMTDYGIDPPTALFGTLKTGDEITINFKTSLQ